MKCNIYKNLSPKKYLIIFFVIFLTLSSIFLRAFFTSGLYLPKPKGYIRINLPQNTYKFFNKDYPYSFEYSSHAKIREKPFNKNEKYWIDIYYPKFNATIHITYWPVKQNKKLLKEYFLEVNQLISRHQVMADEILEKVIINKHKVKIIFTEIFGEHVASQCQFYSSDFKKHFILGSLYFDAIPNQEYLKPMIDFIKKDIMHLIDTFNWK